MSEQLKKCLSCHGAGFKPQRLPGEGETNYQNRCKALAASPALGGEPKVVAVVRHLQTAFIDGKPVGAFLNREDLPDHDPLIRQVDHRAHVAQLQAEAAQRFEDNAELGKECSRLNRRTAELEVLLREAHEELVCRSSPVAKRIEAALAEGKEHEVPE